MSNDLNARIRAVLPSYEQLPDLLDPVQVAKITGLKKGSLASDRCGARRLGIGFVRCGRMIRYPKSEIGKWLVRNSVDISPEGHFE